MSRKSSLKSSLDALAAPFGHQLVGLSLFRDFWEKEKKKHNKKKVLGRLLYTGSKIQLKCSIYECFFSKHYGRKCSSQSGKGCESGYFAWGFFFFGRVYFHVVLNFGEL